MCTVSNHWVGGATAAILLVVAFKKRFVPRYFAAVIVIFNVANLIEKVRVDKLVDGINVVVAIVSHDPASAHIFTFSDVESIHVNCPSKSKNTLP